MRGSSSLAVGTRYLQVVRNTQVTSLTPQTMSQSAMNHARALFGKNSLLMYMFYSPTTQETWLHNQIKYTTDLLPHFQELALQKNKWHKVAYTTNRLYGKQTHAELVCILLCHLYCVCDPFESNGTQHPPSFLKTPQWLGRKRTSLRTEEK